MTEIIVVGGLIAVGILVTVVAISFLGSIWDACEAILEIRDKICGKDEE